MDGARVLRVRVVLRVHVLPHGRTADDVEGAVGDARGHVGGLLGDSKTVQLKTILQHCNVPQGRLFAVRGEKGVVFCTLPVSAAGARMSSTRIFACSFIMSKNSSRI